MSNDPSQTGVPGLAPYLERLNEDQLSRVLEQVLNECRRREADKLRRDILTHSQALRLARHKR